MCFSAFSSFAGGAVLTAIGSATILGNEEPPRRLFAAIPLVFGLQQISEGVVWFSRKTRGHPDVLEAVTAVFLFAAVILWPTIVPLSVLLMEKRKKRRIALFALLGVGVAVSLAHAVGMLIYEVDASAAGFHIAYTMDSPRPIAMATMTGYLIATIPPLFVSSVRRMPVFGIVIVVSYIATQLFYREYLVSVWCFFAALASAVIWWILRRPTENKAADFAA